MLIREIRSARPIPADDNMHFVIRKKNQVDITRPFVFFDFYNFLLHDMLMAHWHIPTY